MLKLNTTLQFKNFDDLSLIVGVLVGLKESGTSIYYIFEQMAIDMDSMCKQNLSEEEYKDLQYQLSESKSLNESFMQDETNKMAMRILAQDINDRLNQDTNEHE